MTVGSKLVSMSSLISGSALSHLMNIVSSGGFTIVPASDIGMDIIIKDFTANAEVNNSDANVSYVTYDADIEVVDKESSTNNATLTGDIRCA